MENDSGEWRQKLHSRLISDLISELKFGEPSSGCCEEYSDIDTRFNLDTQRLVTPSGSLVETSLLVFRSASCRHQIEADEV